ncbi:hypothetical protein GCM10022254_54780 [Actinomadura meridiana]|uniref:SH3 domain-containing protein n=1 Tax=Actinomadura meridiana TaxID=559626 RepID=A0ABP8CF33_9ACTN
MTSTHTSRRFMMAARLTVLAAATTVGAITMSGQPSAEASTNATDAVPITNSATAANASVTKRSYFCAAYNNVRYWRSPNVDPLGQIHKGQDLTWRAGTIVNGVYWVKVDLWGGRSNVWILRSNATWCN